MKKKVLIIKEDNVFNNIIKKHFQKKEYEVEISTNGSDGLRRAIANKPDAIILDANLPTMSGFVVTKKIRSNDVLKDIPIVMVTPLGQEINANKSYMIGVDEFITMPASLEQVYSKVDRHVDEYQYQKDSENPFLFMLEGVFNNEVLNNKSIH